MKCENCDNDHNGNYGSGRFCSSKCARGFSTKEKRQEINQKTSRALKGRSFPGHPGYFKVGYDFRRQLKKVFRGRKISRGIIESGKHEDFIKFKDDATVKRKLIKYGYLEEKCYMDGCVVKTEWNGKKLVLHLDHKNGNKKDRSLENLRLLCPNCHSQTETYCGGNSKKVRERKLRIISSVDPEQDASDVKVGGSSPS